MRAFDLTVSGGAMLSFALLYFFDSRGVMAAVLPAVFFHELGHALALRLCGTRLTALHVRCSGFRLDYAGVLTRKAVMAALAAGPAFGLIYALIAAGVGRCLGSSYLLCSAGVSLALTLFNLLPVPMLDGGRLLAAVFGQTGVVLAGYLTGTLLLLAGVILAGRGFGPAPAIAGAWLLIGTCKWR